MRTPFSFRDAKCDDFFYNNGNVHAFFVTVVGFINTLLEYLFFYIHVISNLTSYRDRDSISRFSPS